MKQFNVDIHWDFARSIQVEANSEEEAAEIVERMMEKGEIPHSSFEATGDWKLDEEIAAFNQKIEQQLKEYEQQHTNQG